MHAGPKHLAQRGLQQVRSRVQPGGFCGMVRQPAPEMSLPGLARLFAVAVVGRFKAGAVDAEALFARQLYRQRQGKPIGLEQVKGRFAADLSLSGRPRPLKDFLYLF